jgi:hypothetical protein
MTTFDHLCTVISSHALHARATWSGPPLRWSVLEHLIRDSASAFLDSRATCGTIKHPKTPGGAINHGVHSHLAGAVRKGRVPALCTPIFVSISGSYIPRAAQGRLQACCGGRCARAPPCAASAAAGPHRCLVLLHSPRTLLGWNPRQHASGQQPIQDASLTSRAPPPPGRGPTLARTTLRATHLQAPLQQRPPQPTPTCPRPPPLPLPPRLRTTGATRSSFMRAAGQTSSWCCRSCCQPR